MAEHYRQQWTKTVDGIRLAVREWGCAKGPAIVFIHGWSHCQAAFDRQFQSALASNFRLISYDLRGHGDSDHPAGIGAYDKEDFWADDLEAVIKSAGVQSPVLVGWSFGGRIVAHYIHRFGADRVSGANFVSVAAFARPGQPVRGPDSCASRMIDQPFETVAGAAAMFVRKCANTPLTEQEFELMFAAAMATSADARKGSFVWHTEYDEAWCRSVGIPVLVTHGLRDGFTLPDAARAAAAKFPDATLSLYEESGHMPFWDNAERYNAELAKFAQGCFAQTGAMRSKA